MALTGTPGTGKSTVAAVLRADPTLGHWHVLEVADILPRREGVSAPGPVPVDLGAAARRVRQWAKTPGHEEYLVVGHLAHLLPIQEVMLLRCRPSEIDRRLRAKGVSEEDIASNVESERVDVVLKEALSLGRVVWELDATSRSPAEVVRWVISVMNGKVPPSSGAVDWLAVEPPTAENARAGRGRRTVRRSPPRASKPSGRRRG